MMREGVWMRRRCYHLILILCIILAAHVVGLARIPQPQIAEKRPLADWPPPPATLAALMDYPALIDAYVRDRFPLRIPFIVALNSIRHRLGYAESDVVVVGKSGWLFYSGAGALDMVMGRRLSDQEVQLWVGGIQQRIERTEQAGGHFYCIFPPSKPTIYPEMLPGWAPFDPRSEVDQLLEGLAAAGLNAAVDFRPALLAAKPSGQLYFKYDTHWNANGAEVAARVLLARIHQDVPEVEMHPARKIEKAWAQDHDLAGMLGLIGVDHLDDPGQVGVAGAHGPAGNIVDVKYATDKNDLFDGYILNTDNSNGRTLLITHDSFGWMLMPFIQGNFSRVIGAHVSRGFFRQDLMDRFHPDVVVQAAFEVSARFSGAPLPPVH